MEKTQFCSETKYVDLIGNTATLQLEAEHTPDSGDRTDLEVVSVGLTRLLSVEDE